MNIKILRLKNGDDIICDLEKDGNTYFVNDPMLIWMVSEGRKSKLSMDHWLPVEVIKDNFVTLKSEDILAEFYPNESLEEYYTHIIDEFNSVLHAKQMANEMSDEELIETIVALQEGNGSTIH